jgi:hypothetical protein
MTHDVGRLRRRVHALGSRHRGARVPPALRAAIATYARGERAAGASCGAIAERLGVSAESIRRWAFTEPGRGDGALVPVQVVAAAAATPLTVWSPTGYRVDGLSVSEAAELLRRLA